MRSTGHTARSGRDLACTLRIQCRARGRDSVPDRVESHEMKMNGDVMRMRQLDMGPEVPPILILEESGSINVEMMVSAIGKVAALSAVLLLRS